MNPLDWVRVAPCSAGEGSQEEVKLVLGGICRRDRLLDPAAAQDYVAVVEHGALARCDRALRLIEDYLDT